MSHRDRDPYAVLGVPSTADHAAIKAAYRELARQNHPDLATSDAARQRMIEVNRAWEILRDPMRRAELDGRTAAKPATETGATRTDGSSQRGHRPAAGWGAGAAGPPPGKPSGSVLEFGIYLGWSLGEVARVDPIYLDWLADHPQGRRYRDEIAALRGRGEARPGGRRGLG